MIRFAGMGLFCLMLFYLYDECSRACVRINLVLLTDGLSYEPQDVAFRICQDELSVSPDDVAFPVFEEIADKLAAMHAEGRETVAGLGGAEGEREMDGIGIETDTVGGFADLKVLADTDSTHTDVPAHEVVEPLFGDYECRYWLLPLLTAGDGQTLVAADEDTA